MRIRLLGRLQVSRDGVGASLPRSRKTRALLAYLAATREAQSRSWLCDLLWEGPADPRAALRWSLAKLRPLVDDAGRIRLLTEGDSVALDLREHEVDVAELEGLRAARPGGTATESLQRVVQLTRGSFLEGMELDGCHRFDAWLASQREAYHRIRIEALTELLGGLESTPAQALPVALERLTAAPYEERAYIDVARILEALGREEEALTYVERGRVMLDRVLEAEPSISLVTLERRLTRALRSVVAASDALASARRALRLGRPEDVRADLDAATADLEHRGSGGELAKRLEVLELEAHPAMIRYRCDDLRGRIGRLIDEARSAARPDLERHALYLLANVHYQDEDFGAALRETLRAERTGRRADATTLVRSLGDTARCLGMLECHPDRAARLAEEAANLLPSDERPQEVLMALAFVARQRGEYDEALGHLQGAIERIRACEDDWWEGTCLLWRLLIHLERQAPLEALVACGELRGVLWRRDQEPEAAFVAGMEALAASGLSGTPPIAVLDEAVASLRTQDSRWMLAYLQCGAAALEHRAGRGERARERASDALSAARVVKRQNEIVVAVSRLARLDAESGAPEEGRKRLDALASEDVDLGWLSARAVTALASARALVTGR